MSFIHTPIETFTYKCRMEFLVHQFETQNFIWFQLRSESWIYIEEILNNCRSWLFPFHLPNCAKPFQPFLETSDLFWGKVSRRLKIEKKSSIDKPLQVGLNWRFWLFHVSLHSFFCVVYCCYFSRIPHTRTAFFLALS